MVAYMSFVNPDFWCGKRVFVTGHTGFKGSWLSLWLQSMGAEVHGFALTAPTIPALFDVANVGVEMTSTNGDIVNFDAVLSAMALCKPDVVIHMAAQPLVRASYRMPVETYHSNVMGTVNVLECVRQTGTARAVVNVTTDKCYDNKEWVWGYRENDPIGGFDPYSNSKACSELVTNAYRSSFFSDTSVALASVRAGNVIGGGDWSEDRLLPDILRALELNEIIRIRNPSAVRPWQHVLEPLCGYLILAEHLFNYGQNFAECWNFGSSDRDAKPVQWVTERLVQLWGGESMWQLDKADHPHEANYLKLDISKSQSRLKWNPRWSIETALEKTVDWHRTWLQNRDMKAKCLEQISDFQNTF
jgi:CDP-glucose 4,6-dehydratase